VETDPWMPAVSEPDRYKTMQWREPNLAMTPPESANAAGW